MSGWPPPLPLSLTEAAAALRDGNRTSVDLVGAALASARALDDRLGVYRARSDRAALDAAARADRELAAGRDRGPLHGIPFAAEGVAGVAGTRVREAGAVITGTLRAAPASRPRNPWDPYHPSGGPGSGAGSGVAAAMILAGLARSAGAGLRAVTTCCGVSGLTATAGRVPGAGPHGLAPLARSARDCAAVLATIAGHHPTDPACSHRPVEDYLGLLGGSLEGLRLGVDRSPPAIPDGDPALAERFDDAVTVLGRLGAYVVGVRPEVVGANGPPHLPEEAGDQLMRDVDAVVVGAVGHTPAGPVLAASWVQAGRPVLTVPIGPGAGGRPLSMQIAGRPFDEATVLRVGDAYQQITEWHRQVPPMVTDALGAVGDPASEHPSSEHPASELLWI